MVSQVLSNSKGTTLIELIIAIVVAGIILSAMFSSYANIFVRSDDPMVMQQSLLAAKALMEEVVAKPYLDPTLKTLCPTRPANRAEFDNVCDYDGYSVDGVRDNAGNEYNMLSAYTLSVSIERAEWGGATSSVPANCNMKIQVTCANALGNPVVLPAYRTCYEFEECSALCN